MKMNEQVFDYLTKEPRFRERRNKDRGIVNLLMQKHPALKQVIASGTLSKDQIINIVQDYASLDRYWRQTTKLNEELRGSDYDDRINLEQEKKLELGYEPGYYQKLPERL